MYTLNLDKNNLQVLSPKQLGHPPTARKSHSMTIIPNSNLTIFCSKKGSYFNFLVESLVIFGGLGQGGVYLNDLNIFVCLTKTWIRVNMFDVVPEPRAQHSVS